MLVLAIETSCDETAAAVLDEERLYSSIVYSQLKIHQPFGGVVPELASRAHLQTVLPTVEQALQQAGVGKAGLDALAVTFGPGLVGALLVGVNFAKALAFALKKPFVGVNHLEGHLFAGLLAHPELKPPFVALLVSGGHTLLVFVQEWGAYRLLGKTIDDAAGEAYDKVAKMLGLGYPGGPVIDRMAAGGNPEFVSFPRALMKQENFNFSFSGLKTAVLNYIESQPEEFVRDHVEDIVASFQAAVVDVLVEKTIRAAQAEKAGAVLVTGGVARNRALRERFQTRAAEEGLQVFFPSPEYCTDNAAMIGRAGLFHLLRGEMSDFALDARPNLKLGNHQE